MRKGPRRRGIGRRGGFAFAAGALCALLAGVHPAAAADGADGPAAGAAAAPPCLTGAERDGWQVRVLQTQLMVAALSCRGSREAGHVSLYNALVKARRAELRAAADGFRRAVARTAGPRALDREVTAIANGVTRAALERPDFCERAAALARAIAQAPEAPLVTFVRLMPVRIPLPAASCAGGDGLVAAND